MPFPLFSLHSYLCIAAQARPTAPARRLIFWTRVAAALTLSVTLGAAQPGPGSYAASIERLDPFDTTGLDSGVANVLRNYYERTFTDAETWAAVESLRFDGELHFSEESFAFSAFKKKPNLSKVVLRIGERHQLVMGYDGHRAWQLDTRKSILASKMPEAEARNFIRDATTGGHLLYPGIEGKTIELLGITQLDEERAYELRITLPDGQVIRSFLDMNSFAEVQQITINNVSGDEERVRHGNFRIVEGIRIPFTSTRFVDGELVHETRIDEVRANQGTARWMFRMPPVDSESTAESAPPDAGDTSEAIGSESLDPGTPRSFFDFDIE
ncbi:MAG: hypothetical protein GVY36_01440 [Verrucomicrobia bacterium]|jgi:hypothetical protein|nr:hypothetical protein [Verrucomicrobiota bacterium]